MSPFIARLYVAACFTVLPVTIGVCWLLALGSGPDASESEDA